MTRATPISVKLCVKLCYTLNMNKKKGKNKHISIYMLVKNAPVKNWNVNQLKQKKKHRNNAILSLEYTSSFFSLFAFIRITAYLSACVPMDSSWRFLRCAHYIFEHPKLRFGLSYHDMSSAPSNSSHFSQTWIWRSRCLKRPSNRTLICTWLHQGDRKLQLFRQDRPIQTVHA